MLMFRSYIVLHSDAVPEENTMLNAEIRMR
jgi:hypothetical protein